MRPTFASGLHHTAAAILLAALPAAAQTDGTDPVQPHPSAARCPAAFTVHRYGLAVMQATDTPDARPSPYAQSLELDFRFPIATVASVTLLIHGSSGKAQAMPVFGNTPPADTASESLHLASSGGRFDPVQHVVTTNVPLVTQVELTDITYTDGATWHEATPNTCIATPSLYVPVTATAVPAR